MTASQKNCNILLIHTDQHRWDCLGVAGNQDIKTPSIDNLAGDGVLYPNAFCSFPVCTPSRYSLLSGLPVSQHLGSNNRSTLAPAIPTFVKELRKNGYNTAAVGKMHFHPTYLDAGFDTMVLAEQDGPGRFDDDYHRWLKDNGLADRIDYLDQESKNPLPEYYQRNLGSFPSDLPEEFHSTTWIAERALEQLDSWGESRNMMMIGFIKPHHPMDPPKPWDEMYDPAKLPLLPGWTESTLSCDEYNNGFYDYKYVNENSCRRALAMYYAAISQIDHHVGRIVDRLKEKSLYDNTLIIFTSDHGDYMGFHRMILKQNNLYDPLVRVPLIIKYPGNANAGTVSDIFTSNTDLAPTVLNIAQTDEIPGTMEGQNLENNHKGREEVVIEMGRTVAIRTRTHKLQISHAPERCLLFDLEKDPWEMENLYHDPDAKVVRDSLEKKLLEWLVFETAPKAYFDPVAPLSPSPNKVTGSMPEHQSMREYLRKAMDKPLELDTV